MLKTLFLLTAIAVTGSIAGCSSKLFKPESRWAVEDYYSKAKSEFESKNWSTAIEYYEKLKANYPYGSHAEQSYLELGYAYYKFSEPLSAMRELDEFIRIYPKHRELPYAYYLKAVAADSINKSWLDSYITDPATRDRKTTMEAYFAYQEVITRFPETKYAKASQQRLIILNNRLARSDLKIAEYYYNRKAYLAAANRAEDVLRKYPLAQSNRKALNLLKKANEKLGLETNVETIKQVEEANL